MGMNMPTENSLVCDRCGMPHEDDEVFGTFLDDHDKLCEFAELDGWLYVDDTDEWVCPYCAESLETQTEGEKT